MPLPLSSLSALARSLTYSTTPGPSLRASRTNQLINPRGHCITEDGYIYHVGVGTGARDKASSPGDGSVGRSSIADLSDEALLARFTRGFFGGTVFWPESLVLRALAACGMIGSTSQY